MAKNYSKRLSNLRTRRLGLDAGPQMFTESASERLRKSEAYEGRGKTEATRYTLGAMQQVDPDYTRIGLEEAERVGRQLKDGLEPKAIPITLELQGSVPLNVHIRGASDVDLLAMHAGFLTVDPRGSRTAYYSDVAGTPSGYMRQFRSDSETVLETRFWGATVDTSGAKSIKLSDGSLRRKVDVVPAHWHDTTAYQESREKHDREVRVWDKHAGVTIPNLPFMHIKRINDKDTLTGGGLKKTIRLLKNIRKDAEDDGQDIPLTSYDLASIMWHCDSASLTCPAWLELSLLASVQAHLEALANNYSAAAELWTPDRSRKIFDKGEKFTALVRLSAEVDELALDVAREVGGALTYAPAPTRDTIRRLLGQAQIAA